MPAQSVTSETLAYSGRFNTADVLNDLPALTFSTTSETSNQDGGVAHGQNMLDLRGKSEVRTLVLVDGRRHVSGVVNFIMKKDFEGLDFNVKTGLSGEGDADSTFKPPVLADMPGLTHIHPEFPPCWGMRNGAQ